MLKLCDVPWLVIKLLNFNQIVWLLHSNFGLIYCMHILNNTNSNAIIFVLIIALIFIIRVIITTCIVVVRKIAQIVSVPSALVLCRLIACIN